MKYIKLAASGNLGNVFSILLASAWLPFQPMTPIQLLTQVCHLLLLPALLRLPPRPASSACLPLPCPPLQAHYCSLWDA